MFLTGPTVVRGAIGEHIGADELGGPWVHAHNGVSHLTAVDDLDAISLARRLVGFLSGEWRRAPHIGGPSDDPSSFIPAEKRRVYDVRGVARCLLDAGEFLELQPRWARNLVRPP